MILQFEALLIFALLVSIVFGVLISGDTRARVLYAAKSFGLFLGVAFVVGWVMRLLNP
jgi:hypothetical protein